ncbi:DUF790 family protein [Haloprofundus sp. MHR1]|uniref:DUF790 family protein n=1 Tax=Haloprofundus sp. MHR1 TaxID=2572921 RepID=UPI0010BEB3ED|nr:DUF790 family protein [Haloprofundus sp. MHR1]QCJ48346.1 DUF790 family protein [Haloprofundus sp. MHR1]
MLTKDLLRVSRRGGGYRPQFVDSSRRPLAVTVLGTYEEHVGERRGTLTAALDDLEAESDDFKLVRGFAALVEREATFETDAALPPERTRRAVFESAEAVGGVATDEERAAALDAAADRLGVATGALETSLYADRDVNQRLAAFDSRWSPDELLAQYNLSLAQTALFDATEVRVRSSDPKALVSAVKRLRLMYEIRRTERGREVVVTGPDALFRRTRRYGTGFARLLRTVATSTDWSLTATIDDRGTDRELTLTDADVSVPGVEPVAEPTYDSGVESDFAARFASLDLDWALVREPEPLETGYRVMIPDFAFDYKFADFRIYFEIMGFWTPEYVEKKLSQLEGVEGVEMLVAVDESLGVSEEIEARDHRAIPYSGSVRLKDVRDALRSYEEQLVTESASDLPAELRPDADVTSFEALAEAHGVSEAALEDVEFPDHRRVGRTLIRSELLEELTAALEPGMSLEDAEALLSSRGVTDSSSVLSEAGYEVAWEGLSGGTLRRKE